MAQMSEWQAAWVFVQLALFPDDPPPPPPPGVAATTAVVALRARTVGKRPRQLQLPFSGEMVCPKSTTTR